MIRLAVYLLIGYLIFGLFKRATGKPADKGKKSEEGETMILDPVCGVYIPAKEAVSKKIHGEIVYFCSDECRRRYGETDREC